MAIEFPVNYNIHDLTVTGFTLANVYKALGQNISGSIDEVVLPAVADPNFDKSHFAPWFDGSAWNVWDRDGSTYKPTTSVIGNVTLSSTPTANRVQLVQNKSGTIALLDDVYKIRPSITLQEGLVSVDWDIASQFRVILSGNRQSVFYMQHSKAGMTIGITVINSGTNQVINAWDAAIKWPAATPPTMPASNSGYAKALRVTLRNINGTIYGDSTSHDHKVINSTELSKVVPSMGNTGSIFVNA